VIGLQQKLAVCAIAIAGWGVWVVTHDAAAISFYNNGADGIFAVLL
jgi:hypothetical protein